MHEFKKIKAIKIGELIEYYFEEVPVLHQINDIKDIKDTKEGLYLVCCSGHYKYFDGKEWLNDKEWSIVDCE